MRYDGERIYEIIPNRKPLMVLDYIEIIDDCNSEGGKLLCQEDWFFECHYPGNPIFPICLLIESMAQVFSAIFYSKYKEIPVVYSLGPIKMLGGATVGDSIRYTATVIKNRRGVISGICKAYVKKENEDFLIASMDIVDVVQSEMVNIKNEKKRNRLQ